MPEETQHNEENEIKASGEAMSSESEAPKPAAQESGTPASETPVSETPDAEAADAGTSGAETSGAEPPCGIGIRFDNSGRTYCFKASPRVEVRRGDRVVVESELGISIGLVVRLDCPSDVPLKNMKPVLRKVTEADLIQEAENEKVKKEAREFGNERIAARGLEMKLLATDVTLDRKRFIFYFVADTRIDFRELVKDLASKFKTRIELRQIGVRDAAKLVGGFGVCGREFCCKTFLKGFAPISIKMAKQQNLVLNTCKLSGICGRLMCCLAYEYDTRGPMRKKKKGHDEEDEIVVEEMATPQPVQAEEAPRKKQRHERRPERRSDAPRQEQARPEQVRQEQPPRERPPRVEPRREERREAPDAPRDEDEIKQQGSADAQSPAQEGEAGGADQKSRRSRRPRRKRFKRGRGGKGSGDAPQGDAPQGGKS